LRIWCRDSFLKQYEKVATVLRMELVSNNVRDFGLKESLAYWAESETHIAWAHYESH
jgi:hypothetical protein